jgi:isopenicillin N synthase-like dioxygenase
MDMVDIEPVRLSLVDDDLDGAAARLGEAFAQTGFAVICDHGIAPAVIKRAMGASKALFALSDAAKAAYVVPGGAGQRGMTRFGIETAKGAGAHDLKEFWHVGRELPAGHALADVTAPNVWPWEWPDFKPAVLELYNALEVTALKILKAIAVYLELPVDFFEPAVRDGSSVLRLLHYPPLRAGAGEGASIRAGAHEDINVITLLLGAEEAGLQLLGRDGVWRDIAAPEGSLVCNIGDMLQRLSGGRLPSTTHRVVNPAPDRAGRSRYSMPFFLHFRPDYEIETMRGGPQHWPPITAQAYLDERLREIGLL